MIYHRQWFPFRADSIRDNVPPTSGVFLLYSHQECVYVGAHPDMRAELTRLLQDGGSPCLGEHPPDEFLFEVALGDDRLARRDELMSEFNPLCKD